MVIIDGIENPDKCIASRNIKKEIKKNTGVRVKIAYQLPRGGVAIQTDREEDAEKLLEEWPLQAFANQKQRVSVHQSKREVKCVL